MTHHLTFPDGFLWGSATAAYQIEGAVKEDGRTDSIWDEFSRVPGAVHNQDSGETAVDHYHRWPDDVRLMRSLNLGSYRFSLAWPRVRPDGGEVNPAGLAFYDRLVDDLLAQDILPWVTLYHWDLPQALELQGGWTARSTVDRFVDYALTAQEALGDRVKVWTTLNEPWCSAFLGYAGGQHAPGRQDPAAAFTAMHHLLLAHGTATEEMRRRQPDARFGITVNLSPVAAYDDRSAADLDAARRIDGLQNRVFLDPLLTGSYPDDVLADSAHLGWTEAVRDGDLATIAQPLDLLGVNYYTGATVSGRPVDDGEAQPAAAAVARPTSTPYPTAEQVSFPGRGLPRTAMGWEIQPEGLHELLVRLHRDYDLPPVYITENGAAFDDVLEDDGVHDADRIAYVDAHLRAVRLAIDDGVDVRGYFVWSLLDNFEWAYGYEKRFGIVHVDYDTLERTPKDSARWFAEVARSGALHPLT